MKPRLSFMILLAGVTLISALVFIANETDGYGQQAISGGHRLSGPTAALIYVRVPTPTLYEQVCQDINSGKVRYTFRSLVDTLGPPQKFSRFVASAPDGSGAMYLIYTVAAMDFSTGFVFDPYPHKFPRDIKVQSCEQLGGPYSWWTLDEDWTGFDD